jgi:hypothetical protein
LENLVYIIDLDGTVWEDMPNEEAHYRTQDAEVYHNAVDWINKRFDEGDFICFFTSRWESLRRVTEDKLKTIGVRYHQLIMDKPRLRYTKYCGYHYIDNCAVLKASRFEGVWTELVEKNMVITVFDGQAEEGEPRRLRIVGE